MASGLLTVKRDWRGLKTVARAMTVSALGAGGSGLLSAAATKILAVTLGPSQMAVLTTLQQLRSTAIVVATANGQTAVVRGASALESQARREYLRTAAWAFGIFTACAALVLFVAPETVANWTGLNFGDPAQVRGLAWVVWFSSIFVFESALLNARGAIGTLALLQLAGPGASALLAWPFAHRAWFWAFLTTSAAVSAGAAFYALMPHRRVLLDWFCGEGRQWSWPAAGRFFSLSGATLATGLAALAALVTVRSWILRDQGLGITGQFDAAWGISMNQVTLVLASLQTYYLPELARSRTAEERGIQIGRVLLLASPVAAAVVVIIASAKPFFLSLLYSSSFEPATQYLRWTLLGDYLKVASWILSVPMLAMADLRMFFVADLASSGVFISSAAALTRWRPPADSAAIAFVLMHVVHLAICAVYVARRHAFRLASFAVLIWLVGLGIVGAVSAVNWS